MHSRARSPPESTETGFSTASRRNKNDPATPYRWAQALSRDLASGVLLGWDGNGHTAYMMGSSCVDTIVDSYLIDGTVPKSGTVCR